MRRYYYEDGRWPWRADEVLVRFLGEQAVSKQSSQPGSSGKRNSKSEKRKSARRALDLGMGYGRNALWLAEKGYEVEGWEKDAQYVREARRELRRRQESLSHPPPGRAPTRSPSIVRDVGSKGATSRFGSVILRQGDFTRARFRGPYDVIVISCVLHMMRQSAAVLVLRRAKAALARGGRLFLLVKLTHDRRFREFQRSPGWEPVRGERNTLRRRGGRGLAFRGPRGTTLKVSPVQSRFEPGELRRALRGLRVVHYREVVLRSEWEHPRPVTHTVAEVVGERV